MTTPRLSARIGLRLALLAGAALGAAVGGCSSSPTTARRAPPPAEDVPAAAALFEDVTTDSGIAFTYRNGEAEADHYSILESLGGGAALIDYDGDGRLDVYLPGGGGYAGADRKRITGRPGKLYRNRGGGRFEDATAAAGLEALAGNRPWFYTHGAAVADFDRDGWADLLVTGWGAVALFRNVPVDPADPTKGRRFEDVTAAAGLDKGITWATSAAFADLDGDGYPDLYVCQYVDWSWAKNPPCNYDGKTPDVCPPRYFSGLTHKLFRNTGKGGFIDVGAAAGLTPGSPTQSKGLGVLIVDVDGDGKPDVYVANDTVDKFLYLNNSRPGVLRFAERGVESGAARDDRGNANGSMGLDAGDPERTGRPSLWVTNYENEVHALYKNESSAGRPSFSFRSSALGIGAIGQKYVGWGTAFLDADLDGWEDLLVVNGHAVRFPTGKAASRRQRPVLLMNQGGTKFREARKQLGGYAADAHQGRGAAFGDLDNDGRTDVVISHLNEPAVVLRGTGGAGNHWIGVRLIGKDHACVVGARATWESRGGRQTRFAKGGGSYASSGDRRLLFGLGAETTGRLTVRWPDGTEQAFDGLAVDRYYRVTRDAARPEEEGVRK
jgi:hypothetical protein